MRVPQEFKSAKDVQIIVRLKHPILGELQCAKALNALQSKMVAVER